MQHPATDGPGSVSYMSPLGYQHNSCGYCKSRFGPKSKPETRSRISYYASSQKDMHPVHYQGLVNRGWRRSGTIYYKPDVRHSCCPHYTIRLDASAFKPRKDQRKAVNRFTGYVIGQEYRSLAARLCPKTREEKKRRKNYFDLAEAIHEAEYKNLKHPTDPKSKQPIEPAHKFEVTIEEDKYTEEKYRLFKNYQQKVHKESLSEISAPSFRRFLCSGLGQSTLQRDGKERRIGSYHQCYRLDGRLVAIGVLDLLPDCVSSVYLIYHESVSDWDFGKLSALQEIALALEDGYRYYYMGYYIHSCIKMRYKATFHPTYVLDPETYNWGPLDEDFKARLSAQKYVSLSRERRLEHQIEEEDINTGSIDNNLSPSTEPDDEATSISDPSSLFNVDMPGIPSVDQLISQTSVHDIRYRLQGAAGILGDVLPEWDPEQMTDPTCALGIIAEFAAAVGPELIKEIVVSF